MPPKIATRSSLEQVAILDSMMRSRPVTADEMAIAIGATTKTVYRHIGWMRRKFGLLIVRRGQTWMYTENCVRIFTDDALRCIAR